MHSAKISEGSLSENFKRQFRYWLDESAQLLYTNQLAVTVSSRQLTLAITTGDADGIGLEVTLKALLSLPIKKKLKYCVYLPFKTHYKFNKLIQEFLFAIIPIA